MKRLLSVIVISLSVSTFFSVRAQSFEELLQIAESTKVHYGETDNRYLDALSQAIVSAYKQRETRVAQNLRIKHSEIVKTKFGENSKEYAEDIWRLGNISEDKGNQYLIECYGTVSSILHSIGEKNSYLYCDSQWRLFWAYQKENDWLPAINSIKQYLEYAPGCVDRDWKGNTVDRVDIAHAYYLLAASYATALGDMNSAVASYKDCVKYIEQNGLQTDYLYTLSAHDEIASYYANLGQNDVSLDWLLRCVEVAKSIYGELSDEYLSELSKLRICYLNLNRNDNQIELTKHILEIIEKRDLNKGLNPALDDIYVNDNIWLYRCLEQTGTKEDVIPQLSKLLDLYKQRGEERSELYWVLLGELFHCHLSTGNYDAAIALSQEYDSLSGILGKKDGDGYFDFLIGMSDIYANTGKEIEHEGVTREIEHFLATYDSRNAEISDNRKHQFVFNSSLARQLLSLEKSSDADLHIERCEALLESNPDMFDNQVDSLLYNSLLHSLKGKALIDSDPEAAEKLLIQSINEKSIIGKGSQFEYNQLGFIYYDRIRDYHKALYFFEKGKEEAEQESGTHSLDYISALINIGLCYDQLGLSNESISILDHAEDLVKKNYGEKSDAFVSILMNKAIFYNSVGDNYLALAYGDEAKNLCETINGKKSKKYGRILSIIGSCLSGLGRIDESINCYQEASVLLGDSFNSIFPLINLMALYTNKQDWAGLEDTADKCVRLISSLGLEGTDVDAYYKWALGRAYETIDCTEANNYYELALNILSDKGQAFSEKPMKIMLDQCEMNIRNQSINETAIPKLVSHYKKLYLENALFFNSLERESFVSFYENSSLKNILFSSRVDGVYDSLLFDYLLFNKGLLLGTSLGYYNAVMQSNDETLIGKYNELNRLNRALNGEVGLLTGTTSINEAKSKAILLEHELTELLKEQDGHIAGFDISFSDVKKELNRNEAAIEFVNYFDYKDNASYYAALLIRKELDTPLFVKLGNEEDIQAIAALSPNVLYGETFASERAYKTLLQPLIDKLGSINVLYYSPAGCLNAIALEYLYDGRKYIGEEYRVIRLSSSREIANLKSNLQAERIALYGGINYDEDDETMIRESRRLRGESEHYGNIFRGPSQGDIRKGWDYLPGTLTEVQSISNIIGRRRIEVALLTDSKANEESFKVLSGRKTSIIHLATHGFYFSEENTKKNGYYLLSSEIGEGVTKHSSALQRAGLLLSGGNKAWKGEPVPEGIEDGVLTAMEIASLDLTGCEVAVLSACETGVGEISDEGVFGLQRAFKIAGVKTIVMSLWDVDDQATSLMMSEFYKNLLKGKGKRDSFYLAQREVKKVFSDPRYWAAFIMLD